MLIEIDGKFAKIDNTYVSMETTTIPTITKHYSIYKIEDVYANVRQDERIIFVTRHGARNNDTSITGDLNSTGINQCIKLGNNLSNPYIDLNKTYIGGSYKYRALNTAYQTTKAMGVAYPSDYDYLKDTDKYAELMEVNFFVDSAGESSGVSLETNAYYSYIDDTLYSGSNKVDNHVYTKSQELINIMLDAASAHDADLCWFGTHDKVIIPLLAYVTDRKEPLHIERNNSNVIIKKSNPLTGITSGSWSIPLLSGVAFVVNKFSGNVNIYPVESTPFL